MESLSTYLSHGIELAIEYLPKVLLAILVLLIGLGIIKSITKLMSNRLEKKNFDSTLRPFIVNLTSWILKIALFISIAAMVGVETASFVAVLGAFGLAVGLALQGTLGNFAGGVLILIFKPFKVGDYIEAQGYAGTVEEIKIITTTLVTPNNETVIIPNGALSNGNIINYTIKGIRRMALTIGISYNADIKQAKEIMLEIIKNDPRVLKDPAPTVVTVELADSSVNLSVRPWTTVADYWPVMSDITEQIKYKLDDAQIGIPYPQTDVHLYKVD